MIKDDMKALYPKVRAADALVFASPIYFFTMSAQTNVNEIPEPIEVFNETVY